jgi:hypothetical protein
VVGVSVEEKSLLEILESLTTILANTAALLVLVSTGVKGIKKANRNRQKPRKRRR